MKKYKRDNIDTIYNSIYRVDKLYEKWAKKNNIGYYNMLLFYYLIEEGKMTKKEICDEIEIPKQTLNNIVKSVKEQGYIQLEVNPLNKKEKEISLTQAGKEYAEKLIFPLFEMEEYVLSQIPVESLRQVVQTLNLFGDIFSEKMEKF